jgi:hypothetical protein
MKTFQSRQDGRRRMMWTVPLAIVMVVGTATVAVSALKTVLPDDRSAHSTSMTAGAGHGSSSASLPTAALRDFLADTRSQAEAPVQMAPVQMASAAGVTGRSGPSGLDAAAQVKLYSQDGAPLVSAEPGETVRPVVRPVVMNEADRVTVRQRLERLWSAGIFR